MQCKEIIADIDHIYERFHVMPNLSLHMKRVAGVVAFIADHWDGPPIDRELLIAAALTHDLGNIAKADFDGPHQERIMGAEYARKEHWKRVQRELMMKYGDEEYKMTGNMLRELRAPESVFKLTFAAGFRRNMNTAACDDWNCKILAHADHIVSPQGVVSLDERLEEGATRYGYTASSDPLVRAAHVIEDQIAEHLIVPVESITEESTLPYREQF